MCHTNNIIKSVAKLLKNQKGSHCWIILQKYVLLSFMNIAVQSDLQWPRWLAFVTCISHLLTVIRFPQSNIRPKPNQTSSKLPSRCEDGNPQIIAKNNIFLIGKYEDILACCSHGCFHDELCSCSVNFYIYFMKHRGLASTSRRISTTNITRLVGTDLKCPSNFVG